MVEPYHKSTTYRSMTNLTDLCLTQTDCEILSTLKTQFPISECGKNSSQQADELDELILIMVICLGCKKLESFGCIIEYLMSKTKNKNGNIAIDIGKTLIDDSNVSLFKAKFKASCYYKIIDEKILIEDSPRFSTGSRVPPRLRQLPDTITNRVYCKNILHCLLDVLMYQSDADLENRHFGKVDDLDNSIATDFSQQLQLFEPITLDQLQYGIKLYKKLIKQNPSLMFLTTFCYDLPHIYSNNLITQLKLLPLIQNNGNEIQLSEDALKILSNIYESFATFEIKNSKLPRCMSAQDFVEYIKSCWAGYVYIYLICACVCVRVCVHVSHDVCVTLLKTNKMACLYKYIQIKFISYG